MSSTTGNSGAYFRMAQDWLLNSSDDNWRLDAEVGGSSRAFADIGSHPCDLVEFVDDLSLTRSEAKTAPVGLHEFTGMYGTDWGGITAGATLIITPILILTIVLRRKMVSGSTLGAVK